MSNIVLNWHKTYALPCMTIEDSKMIYKKFLVEGDHSCGCGGDIDGCPWCSKEKLIEYRREQILNKFGWSKL
jgi:hypothetical protein